MERSEARLGQVGAPDFAVASEEECHGVVDITTGALWYPVGILLALVAASSVIAFCCPGRWIG
jgi:hypothetical protein